jgi:RNA polymerase sigma factor (sigma-70 family)
MDHPDSKYINALTTNNEPLLKELYQKCFGKIRYFIINNHGTEEDAWDTLQEAMLSIFFKLKQKPFILTCPFDAFVYIVCRNLWIKELRKKKHTWVTPDPDMVYAIKAEDDIALAEECNRQHQRRKLLLEKLDELSEGCRELLQQNWRGARLDEVAVKLKITYAYARKRKTECMAKLIFLIRQSPVYGQLKW